MTDVQIQIGANADITGLQKLETGYQSVLTKARQVYQEISSPITAIADRADAKRGLDDLNQKANEIKQQIARTRLDQLSGGYGPAAGPGYLSKLKTDLEMVQLQGDLAQGGLQQPQPILGRAMGAGRFLGGKALKYGGAIAGVMGAYSLFSNISERMGVAEEGNMRFATGLSAMRGKTSLDYSAVDSLYQVNELLNKMGQTAFMTAKDMIPFVDVMEEMTSTFRGNYGSDSYYRSLGVTRNEFVQTANIGKSLRVDSSTLSGFLVGGMRQGGFSGPEGSRMSTMLMLNENMMHRATESIQAMQQLISGTIHGTQGPRAYGMYNLMQTLNESKFQAYRGTGGAQSLLGINQAFRGGGNQNLEYFRAMALNPAFQDINQRRLAEFNSTAPSGPTNYSTGRYDQLISDVFQELGAFATSGDVTEQLRKMGFSGASEYVAGKYKDPTKMNIERLFDQYRGAYGTQDEGRRFLMTAQMSKDLGVSFADIGVLNEALKDDEFMRRSREKGLGVADVADARRKWTEAGAKLPEMEKYMTGKMTSEDHLQAIARDIKKVSDGLLPVAIRVLSKIESFTSQTASAIDSVVDFFNTGEGPSAVEINKKNREAIAETFNEVISGISTIVTDFKTWAESPENKNSGGVNITLPGSLIIED